MTAASLPWLHIALALPYGLVVGAGYFLALRANSRLYLADGPVWKPVVLLVGRLLGAVALLGVLVLWGWAPTLAGLGGFSLARPLVVRWSDRRSRVPAAANAGGEG